MAVVSIKNRFLKDSCCSLVSIPNHSPETTVLKVCRDYSLIKFNYFLFSFLLLLDFAPVLTTPYSLNILPVSITRQDAVLSLSLLPSLAPHLPFCFLWRFPKAYPCPQLFLHTSAEYTSSPRGLAIMLISNENISSS